MGPEWSRVPINCPGVKSSLSQRARVVGRPSRRARRGPEALPEGKKGSKAIQVGRVRSGGSPRGPRGVGMYCQRAGAVRRLSWREGGRKALPEGRGRMGYSPEGLREVGMPCWRAGGQESLLEGWGGWEALRGQ